MKYDLKSLNRKELEKLKANVEKALARVEKTEMKEALAAAEKAAKAHGFDLAEITGGVAAPSKAKRKAAAKPKKPGVAKYANPDDKTQTWTGKGRRPDWFVAAMKAGKTPEQLEI
jgi:DNA-binding protein H-NS